MTIKIFDYTDSTEDIFYKIIYPVYAKEFLYGSNYEDFAFLVQANFKLNMTIVTGKQIGRAHV